MQKVNYWDASRRLPFVNPGGSFKAPDDRCYGNGIRFPKVTQSFITFMCLAIPPLSVYVLEVTFRTLLIPYTLFFALSNLPLASREDINKIYIRFYCLHLLLLLIPSRLFVMPVHFIIIMKYLEIFAMLLFFHCFF